MWLSCENGRYKGWTSAYLAARMPKKPKPMLAMPDDQGPSHVKSRVLTDMKLRS
jgi:hypothetical protein